MRAIRALIRFLKGVRDRIVWIIQGIFGPLAAALRRLLLALRDRFDELVGRLLACHDSVQPIGQQHLSDIADDH